MSEQAALDAGSDADGERVDAFLARRVEALSRSLAAHLVRDGKVRVNGSTVRPAHRLRTGDHVEALIERPPSLSAAPEPIPLQVVYQDNDLVVIDKPAGLVVHPAPGHAGGTVANALAALFPQTETAGNPARPGIVHRLDKDTSGLMVVALSRPALASLQEQIASRTADRRYLALVSGHLPREEGRIEAPIGRDTTDRKRMAVHGAAARMAATSYRVLERLPGFDLVEAKLHTGRTHQIRVHFAAAGHPVAGDAQYGGTPIPALHRQFLHAYSLRLRSPSDGSELQFTSPLPSDLEAVLARLRRPKGR